jgi:hypothetical protein
MGDHCPDHPDRPARAVRRARMDLRTQVRRIPCDRGHGERPYPFEAREPDAPLREAARVTPGRLVLDGEIVALDAAGRPVFADLMFGRRPPIFVAFDVLTARGKDVRTLPLARRKAVLKRLARGANGLGRSHGWRAGPGPARWASRATSQSASPIHTTAERCGGSLGHRKIESTVLIFPARA